MRLVRAAYELEGQLKHEGRVLKYFMHDVASLKQFNLTTSGQN
jgi:hypothetical protein